MKKFIVFALFALLATGMVFSASLTVTANVSKVLNLSINSASLALDIDNTGSAVVSTPVNLTLVSSQKNWSISFHSTNAGKLVNGSSNTPIDYEVLVDTETNFSTGVSATGNELDSYVSLATDKYIIPVTTANGGKTDVGGVVFPMTIRVPDYSAAGFFQTLGTGDTTVYSDTITITVTATN